MRHLRQGLTAVTLVLGLAAVAVAVIAPQAFVLAREGFPAPRWPASGDFARVAGCNAETAPAPCPFGRSQISPPEAPAPATPRPGPDFAPAVLTRFADSGGRALLVDRGGRISQTYGPDLDAEVRLNSYSLVKGLVGALTLRAIADGRIGGLDTPLRDLLGPDAPPVTIGEALTMTGGLYLSGEPDKAIEDAGFAPWGGLARLHAFGLDAVMPGLRADAARRGRFAYASVNTALLGRALERAYDRPLPDLLSDLIWRPAGAADAYWRRYPGQSEVSAYCCLYARPVDWLRVGRFLMRNGTPQAPFLPDAMWRDWMIPDLPDAARRTSAYGQHIRHDVLDRPGQRVQGPFSYFMGHGGQMVWFLPARDAVVVRFGDHAQLLHSTIYELFP